MFRNIFTVKLNEARELKAASGSYEELVEHLTTM